MRIIAGVAKGRKLKTPKNNKTTRPAMAKVRESILSSIQPLEGKLVMDLYAGTGSLGLECLSRLAENCYFVDSDERAVKLIRDNINALDVKQRAVVLKRRLPQGLKGLFHSRPFDIVFCDPPYEKNLINKTLDCLVLYKLIDPQSLIIVEHNQHELPHHESFSLIRQKQFGQTLVSFLMLKSITPNV